MLVTLFCHVAMCSCGIRQVVREVERLEEMTSSLRGGRETRELRRLQRRVKNVLDDWLEFYRVATGKAYVNLSLHFSTHFSQLLSKVLVT